MTTRATKINLEANQYADFDEHLVYFSGGSEVDLTTGYTAEMEIASTYYDNESKLTLSTENGRLVLGVASPGDIHLKLTPDEVEILGPFYDPDYQDFKYDLLLCPTGGVSRRLFRGRFRVWRGVTRRG